MIEAVQDALTGLTTLPTDRNNAWYKTNYDLSEETEIVRCLRDHTSEFKGIGDDVFTIGTFKDGFKTATERLFPGLIRPPTSPPP